MVCLILGNRTCMAFRGKRGDGSVRQDTQEASHRAMEDLPKCEV